MQVMPWNQVLCGGKKRKSAAALFCKKILLIRYKRRQLHYDRTTISNCRTKFNGDVPRQHGVSVTQIIRTIGNAYIFFCQVSYQRNADAKRLASFSSWQLPPEYILSFPLLNVAQRRKSAKIIAFDQQIQLSSEDFQHKKWPVQGIHSSHQMRVSTSIQARHET